MSFRGQLRGFWDTDRIGRMPVWGRAFGWAVSCFFVVLLAGSPVLAESLRDALTAAYQTNPGLDAERARLRATDENIPRAKAGYRPTVTGEGSIAAQDTKSSPSLRSDGTTKPTNWQLSVRQPLFDGFRTRNAVNAAEASVRAGRARLNEREASTLLDAATAYMDVVRDKAIVSLRGNNVRVLSRELAATKARRAVKEVTLTDVAQARSRRARAVSDLDFAKANLRISRANYVRVIGHAPDRVGLPPLTIKGLPRGLDEALRIAEQESPRLIAALYQEQEARYSVDRVWGELLPQVDVEARYSHGSGISNTIDERNSASVTGRLRIPFYRGGEVHARVRQAKHTHVGRIQDIEQARVDLEATVTAAWSRLRAARAKLKSDQVQVSAARTALRGVRAEEKVGQRMLLDVLNAEQELLDAQVSLVGTKRDLIVASYGVLASIGRLTVDAIALATDVYVPEAHYEEVRRKWAGVTITRAQVEPEPVVEEVIEEELPPVRQVQRRRRRPAPIAKVRQTPDERPVATLERLFRQSFDADSTAETYGRSVDGYAWRRRSGAGGTNRRRVRDDRGIITGSTGGSPGPGFRSSLD